MSSNVYIWALKLHYLSTLIHRNKIAEKSKYTLEVLIVLNSIQYIYDIFFLSFSVLSLLLGPVLRQVPLAVLFGVFLYMGISSLAGLQLFDRFCIFFMPRKYHGDASYVRKVIKSYITHKFCFPLNLKKLLKPSVTSYNKTTVFGLLAIFLQILFPLL